MAKSLVHKPGSNPAIQVVTHDIPSIHQMQDQVLVRFLAVPVDKIDLLVLDGRYPIKPRFSVQGHPVPGFEGCAVVVESASGDFAAGDRVIAREAGLGTWRTHAVLPADALLKLPRETPAVAAALMRYGSMVAWLLCEEVAAPLAEGDWVMLSAGAGCVAQFFVQLARRRGVRTAVVVRDRVDMAETTARLTALGASIVVSESQLARDKASVVPGKLVLALDSVFGGVGQAMLDSLAVGGRYVMVGMLGGGSSAISVGTEHLFRRQLSLTSFRSSEVLRRIGKARAESVYKTLAQLLIDGELKCPDVAVVDWAQAEGDDEGLELLANESIQTSRGDTVGTGKVVWLPSRQA